MITSHLYSYNSLILGINYYDWAEERFEIQFLADDILAKFVPAHVNIFYCFGGIMLTSSTNSSYILFILGGL